MDRDPFDRFEFRRRANFQGIIAFLLGVAAATVIVMLLFGRQPFSSRLFETLIVLAVGGAWYHLRRVI